MIDERTKRRHRVPIFVLCGLVVVTFFLVTRHVCLRAYLFDGLLVPECPDGAPHVAPFVEAESLRRGADGALRVGAIAHYTTEAADLDLTTPVRRVDPRVVLVKGKGEEVPLQPKKGWSEDWDHARRGTFVLPDLPDGEYTLRAFVKTPIGDGSVDVVLPVFAPARIHVITDRPLYQPGNEVKFRAVVLRAKDLAPLDGRPGKWVLEDPSRETVLEEKAAAGDFGVVSGSFPLDAGAPTGDWRLHFVSGGADEVVTFRVEPFKLPRFRVEASTPRAFYRRGERPTISGRVVYSSGAPVKDAGLAIEWSVQGAWPPPSDWLSKTLPRLAKTDASGAFELPLPVVPGDLRGKATITARIAATDAANDRVEGSASILLSEDAIQVSAVTELDEGLVQGFNNRLYLRATTAAGVVLPKTELVVRRAWEPADKGVKATTDEDGVASLQLDPGPPVNVVIPPMPYRPPPRPQAIARGDVTDLLSGEAPSLGDQLAMDGWVNALAPCARFVDSGSESVTLGLEIAPSGAIEKAAGDGRVLSRCLAALLERTHLSAGRARVLRANLTITSNLPRLEPELDGSPSTPPGLEEAVKEAALDARTCLPDAAEGALPRVLVWRTKARSREIHVTWTPDPREVEHVAANVGSCVEGKLLHLTLPELPKAAPADGTDEAPSGDQVGVVRFTVEPRAGGDTSRPQATTLVGYELAITAKAAGQGSEDLGSTKLVLNPGNVPELRLRPASVLAEAGGTVEVSILRGPSFHGELPEKLWLRWERGSIEGKVDKEARLVRFPLPKDAKGWFEVTWSSARALVYVRPEGELAVEVRPESDRYAPGDQAKLLLTTTAGGRPTKAAVGLIGVDASLGQLVSLPGPDDLARLRPKPEMRAMAFDALDASALQLGRIRGANAAAATVLRVSTLPAYADLDASVQASARVSFEPVEALTDHFYGALAELHAQTRAWEEKAAAKEQMHPATMAKLWAAALEACEKRKEPVTDAYGRRLRLHRLPPDLLALTDPRVVVVTGTRLPEDVENWAAWVQKERP